MKLNLVSRPVTQLCVRDSKPKEWYLQIELREDMIHCHVRHRMWRYSSSRPKLKLFVSGMKLPRQLLPLVTRARHRKILLAHFRGYLGRFRRTTNIRGRTS